MSGPGVEIDTESLKYVYFENSEIESFTEEFVAQLKGVEFLNVNDVGLKSVDGRSLGLLDELLTFWGGQNKLERLETNAFSGNKKLEMIYLKFNRISFIHHKAFDGLVELFVLDLSSNKLKEIRNIFESLRSLVKLDLSLNRIEKLDKNVFKNLGELRELNLMKNNLKFLDPDVFKPLLSLEFVNISFNKSPLGIISAELFKHNFHLKQIYLINNKIRAIDRKFLDNLKPSLEIISLRTNSCIDDDIIAANGTIAWSERLKLKDCNENFQDAFN